MVSFLFSFDKCTRVPFLFFTYLSCVCLRSKIEGARAHVPSIITLYIHPYYEDEFGVRIVPHFNFSNRAAKVFQFISNMLYIEIWTIFFSPPPLPWPEEEEIQSDRR